MRDRGAGDGNLTSRHIATLAGVSQTTVSRVLRGSDKVSEATRSKVLKALEETGYVPNVAARVMRTRSTGNVGVVVAKGTSPFYPVLLDFLADAIASSGRLMSLWIADSATEAPTIDAIGRGFVDGIIYVTASRDSRSLALALQRHAPVVLMNRTFAGLECDQVGSDNAAGAAEVARYLVESGCRRIAFVGGPETVSIAQERERGFVAELAALGSPLEERFRMRGEISHAGGERGIASLLELDRPPDAVFCANDVVAMGAMDGARAAGVRVPEDLWIVGFDNMEMGSWLPYGLTTVSQQMSRMATRATELLVERIEGSAADFRHERLPTELILRSSTAS